MWCQKKHKIFITHFFVLLFSKQYSINSIEKLKAHKIVLVNCRNLLLAFPVSNNNDNINAHSLWYDLTKRYFLLVFDCSHFYFKGSCDLSIILVVTTQMEIKKCIAINWCNVSRQITRWQNGPKNENKYRDSWQTK